MPDAENLRLPHVSRFVPYPVAQEVPGEGHQLKLQPGLVIRVVTLSCQPLGATKGFNPLPSFESHGMSSLW